MAKKSKKQIVAPEVLKGEIESAFLNANKKTIASDVEGVPVGKFEVDKPITVYKKETLLFKDILKRCNTIWIQEKGTIRHTQYKLEGSSKITLASGTPVWTLTIRDTFRNKTMEVNTQDIIRLAKVKEFRNNKTPFGSLEGRIYDYSEDYLLWSIEKTIDLGRKPPKNTINPFGRNSVLIKQAAREAKAKQDKANKIQETLPKMEIPTITDEEVLKAAQYKGKRIEALLKKEIAAKQKLDTAIENEILDLDCDGKTIVSPMFCSFDDAKLILCEEFDLCEDMQEVETAIRPKPPFKRIDRR